MQGDVLLLVLLVVLGVAGFFFGAFYVLLRLLGAAGRTVGNLFRGHSVGGESDARRAGTVGRACPRVTCRHVESRSAKFCGRCGMSLSSANEDR